ncbi:hypothetical protein CMV_012027 [Castanea mollissima]|uniref:Uncharacterized protein n=1 Tax=Castanea mollissima TaxID=60419 RepID=A0A8J4RG92_9ROSI|nr:hypothetical protein CMV_012027 [Castanea mollissima]
MIRVHNQLKHLLLHNHQKLVIFHNNHLKSVHELQVNWRKCQLVVLSCLGGAAVGFALGNGAVRLEAAMNSITEHVSKSELVESIYFIIPPLLISIFAHDTPMYYIEMKNFRKARREFTRTRGDGLDSEFDQLKEESLGAWSLLEYVFSRQCRPYLVITSVREICLQLSGMFAISFFLPTLLMKFDVSANASYLAPMVYEYVNFASLIVLLLKGHYSVLYPTRSEAYRFFGFLLAYSLGYGVTSSKWIEVDFPRRASSTAGPMMMSISFSIMFVMTYALLPMICSMKGGLFVLFTVIVICMLVFIYLLVPESSDIPEEEMNEKVWRKHWFWRSYMAPKERLSTSGVEMIGGENENNGSCGGNSSIEKVGTNGGDSIKPFGAKSGMGGGRIKSSAGEFVVSEGVSHGNTK